MRAGRWIGKAVLVAVVVAVEGSAAGACTSTPPRGEDVASTTGPPIKVCYEPDGALCPLLDAGEDAADDAQAVPDGGGVLEAGGG